MTDQAMAAGAVSDMLAGAESEAVCTTDGEDD
jgi:hypothetical protein